MITNYTYNNVFFFKILFTILGFISVCNADSKINLEIQNWGPQEKVNKGEIPNKQPDGNAGLWIKTNSIKEFGDLKVYINNKPVVTSIEANLITANIPKEFFQQKTSLKITIKDSNNFLDKYVGTLDVIGEAEQKNFNILEIYNWGPQEKVNKGEIPNKQPDGNAGLWIKTSSTKEFRDLKVCINDKPVITSVESNLVTASIPKEFFTHKDDLKITIKYSNNSIEKTVGVLELLR